MINKIENCKVIKLESFKTKRRGSLTPLYNCVNIPFDIRRVYYLYDIPAGSNRGEHGHKELEQLMIAASGSFEIILKDGETEKKIMLNSPSIGLYIPKMIWRELGIFSGGAVCMVFASLDYDFNDYLHDYDSFMQYRQNIIDKKLK